VTKDAVSAALALPPGPERDLTLELAERMARDIADPDTRFLGEVFLNQPGADGGAPKRVNAVATPHLWAGILVYLVAMAYERPDLFDRYERVLPAVDIPLPAPKQQGCGCGATPDTPGGALFLLAWLFARVARSRRARHPSQKPES
jgi:MYXO-CTERM domain-containing protein